MALSSRRVRAIADRMLNFLQSSDAELSVLLTDDVTIRNLNAEHRDKDRATDVLAFPQRDDDAGQSSPGAHESLLGDVVISLDTAAAQARRRRHALLDEVTFLLAHGILHLVGYDHQTDAEEAEMNAMTRRLVAAASTRSRRAECSSRPPA